MAIEATAYFVISEALTNVARYAGTGQARVEISTVDSRPGGSSLVATVADDGPGGVRVERGTGLRGLPDRVAMLDGTFTGHSPAGGGTRLRAALPLPPAGP